MNKIGNFLNFSQIKKSNPTFVKYSDRYSEFLEKALKTKDLKSSQSFKLQVCKPHENKLLFIKIKTLGFGAFSSVNMVCQQKTKSIYAMKIIPKSKLLKNRQLLHEQIKIHFKLKHINIIQLYHFYVEDGQLKMILQYAESTLSHYLKAKKQVAEKQASNIIKQILTSISYLHSLGITHRDIKLQNILLSNGIIKICDFGLACRKTIFDSNEFVGTIDYISPESIGKNYYTEKIDIWAIGIILYQLIFGKSLMQDMSQSQKYFYLSKFKAQDIIFTGISPELEQFFKYILVQDNKRLSALQLLDKEFIKIHQE